MKCITFPFRLLALADLTCEPTKYRIDCIRFERDDAGQCSAIVTNTRLLLRLRWQESPAVVGLPLQLMLPASVANVMRATLKPMKADREMVHLFADALECQPVRIFIDAQGVEGRWPPHDEIFAIAAKPSGELATVDPLLLSQLLKCISDTVINPGMPKVSLRTNGGRALSITGKAVWKDRSFGIEAALQPLG